MNIPDFTISEITQCKVKINGYTVDMRASVGDSDYVAKVSALAAVVSAVNKRTDIEAGREFEKFGER